MTEMNKLNAEALEQVTGGKLRMVCNDTVSYANVRTGPGTNYKKTGMHTGRGIFTIMEVQQGRGSTQGWGLLKAYSDKKNGWITLDYAERI